LTFEPAGIAGVGNPFEAAPSERRVAPTREAPDIRGAMSQETFSNAPVAADVEDYSL
jgi:hypothetical protein